QRQLPRPRQPACEPHLDAVLGDRARETGGCRRDHVTRPGATLVAGSALGLAARKTYRLLASGALTLDLDVGRRLQPLGPLLQPIRAPQEVVFDMIAGPYLGKTPAAPA